MSDDDMGACTEDVRTKISKDDHGRLLMVSAATGEDAAAIMRRLLHDYLDAKESEYRIAGRFATAEGIARDSRGSR